MFPSLLTVLIPGGIFTCFFVHFTTAKVIWVWIQPIHVELIMAKLASFDVAVPSLLSKTQPKALLGGSYNVLPIKISCAWDRCKLC